MALKYGNATVQNYIFDCGKKYTVSNYKLNDTTIYNNFDTSTPTDNSYFTFTLLDDDTYSIAAKDVTNMPEGIVLPSEYEGKAVTVVADSGFASTMNNLIMNVKYLYIPASITSIGENAFNFLFALEDVIVAQSSNLTSIGYDAFVGCLAKTVNLQGATKLTEIGNCAFRGSGLVSILLPPSVKIIGSSAFQSCSKITQFTIPTTIQGIGSNAFYGTGLREITIPNNVIYFGSAFSNCEQLIKVTIEQGVTNIDDVAFANCTSLINITIPDSVTSIGWGAFYGCTSLDNIFIPDSVTTMGERVFGDCSTTILCEAESQPSGWSSFWNRYHNGSVVWGYKCKNGHIGEEVWEVVIEATATSEGIKQKKCSACGLVLETTTIPKLTTPEEYFTFTLLDGDTYSVKAADVSNMPAYTIIPDTYNGKAVTAIDERAFQNATNITRVVIPSGVTSIGWSAFYGCSNLESVVLPEGITVIDNNTFEECRKLMEINLPESLTTINPSAFGYCTILPTITIPSAVTYIGGWAFYNCNALTINCKAASQPSGWDANWNIDNRPVIWGYTG